MPQLLMRRPNLDDLPPPRPALPAGCALRAPDVREIFVITRDGVPVATASARLDPDRFPGSGYVHWVAADPAQSGRGLGYAATLATLHAFVALGCRDAVLETDDERLPAIRTYRKLGFAPEFADDTHAARWQAVDAALAEKRS
jgi:mycothiol synthase